MFKISLVLADPDNRYVDRVVDYINSAYGSKVKVTSFTDIQLTAAYLKQSNEEIDVLLVHPSFLLDESADYARVGIVVILSDGNLNYRFDNCPSVSKYQPGDKLIHEIINLYAEKNANASRLVTGSTDTKIIGVYSPVGGVGKTSTALAVAAKTAELGKTVLLISLENISSSISALPCKGTDALTHLLLSLSENPEALPLKVETYKTRDPQLNLEFLEPPDCFLELSEVNKETLEQLLQQLKGIGKYDLIVVDMDSAAVDRNFTILANCDRVLFLLVSDPICGFKTETFMSQLARTGLAEKFGLFEKLLPIVNKYSGGPVVNLSEFGLGELFSVPFIPNLWVSTEGNCEFDPERAFTNAFTGLLKAVI